MIPVTSLHIEPTNICTLKCAGCARTKFLQQWPAHWKNHNLEIEQLLEFIDIDISGTVVHFCGNYGDPIYHPRFVPMIRAVKSLNSRIQITTNGSYRTAQWWQELCELLDENDTIRFSIDGLPDSFTSYRVNGDWQSIEIGIGICSRSKVKTIWKYIPFEFNQHQIDAARVLSSTLGIDEFQVDGSDRFDESTYHLMPAAHLIGSRKVSQDLVKQGQTLAVDPKCAKGDQHFITADGHYSPCCFVADHRFYYKTDFGKNRQQYSIANTTLSQILAHETCRRFFDSIHTSPAKVCQFNCPQS